MKEQSQDGNVKTYIQGIVRLLAVPEVLVPPLYRVLVRECADPERAQPNFWLPEYERVSQLLHEVLVMSNGQLIARA